MRLATKALIAALITIVMAMAVAAQTLRSPGDPRNQAPAVGTGGPPGGPTGLFTVFDADTIRRGEFTFSVAYSNYDRDPGNVDIVDTPLSFNVGLNDHLELFFSTSGYRGVKVNNPQNLSSFYLPNSQLYFSATTLCTGAAIILAPERVSGPTIPTGATFRPAGPPCPGCGRRVSRGPRGKCCLRRDAQWGRAGVERQESSVPQGCRPVCASGRAIVGAACGRASRESAAGRRGLCGPCELTRGAYQGHARQPGGEPDDHGSTLG